MFATYKLMTSSTTEVYLGKTLEELVEDYKKTEDVRKRNKIIAAMFCKGRERESVDFLFAVHRRMGKTAGFDRRSDLS